MCNESMIRILKNEPHTKAAELLRHDLESNIKKYQPQRYAFIMNELSKSYQNVELSRQVKNEILK